MVGGEAMLGGKAARRQGGKAARRGVMPGAGEVGVDSQVVSPLIKG